MYLKVTERSVLSCKKLKVKTTIYNRSEYVNISNTNCFIINT